mmetsp:Transcript_6723/g.16031  ORF Transcript_6723/g.16031 Transcript_6723/m.16031 type:complete len:408 (+) Transcript_6723:177-1400(+)
MAALEQCTTDAELDESLASVNFDQYNATIDLEELTVRYFHVLGVYAEGEVQTNLAAMRRMMTAAHQGYSEPSAIPYHNWNHGVDVGQAVLSLVKDVPHFTKLEKFALVTAAILHDIGHPGVTNAFLIASKNKLVEEYGQESVLEQFHVTTALKVIAENAEGEDGGILGMLNEEQKATFAEVLRCSILATDMARHGKILGDFKARIEAGAYPEGVTAEDLVHEDRMLLVMMTIKCADISNVCRKFDVAEKWTNQIAEEFLAQGDEEKRLGLPVTPMNDRTKFKSPAHMVCGFIDFVAQGTHDELEKVLPSAVPFAQNSRDNRQTFETLKPADPAPPAEVATAQPVATSTGEAASEAASGAPARTAPDSPPGSPGGGGGGGGSNWCGCLAPAGGDDARFTDDGDKSQST